MKQLLKHALFCVCLLGGAAVATSCSDNKDLFDQEEWNKMMEKSFPVSDIQTDWQTVGTATANVSVYKDAGETYTVKLYDSDPLVGTSAVLLAKGSVATGSTFSTKFDYALADSVIYVACIDSKFRREVIPVHNVTDGSSFNVTFGGNSVASKSLSSRAAVSITDPEVAKEVETPTEDHINDMISKATDITDVPDYDIANKGTNSDNYYKITGNFSGNFVAGDPKTGTKVIVTGTWIPNGMEIHNPIEIIVAKGGKIVLNSTLKSTTAKAYAFTVMPGGEITGTHLANSDGGYLFNAGTISVDYMDWAANGGKIYNAKTGTLTTTSTADYNSGLNINSSTDLINYGAISVASKILAPSGGYVYNASGATMYAKYLQLTSGATLINHGSDCRFGDDTSPNDNAYYETDCKLVFDGKFNPKSLKLGDNASVECSELTLHAATVTMGNASILKATTSNYGGFTMNGPTSGNYAIFVAGNVVNSGWGTCIFNNRLYVDVTSHPSADNTWDWYNTKLTYNNGASAVGHGEASETIPAGDCSCGYNSNSGHEVVDPVSFTTTYCFEDNYPYAGDYDFNDAVFAIGKTVSGSTVTLAVKLKAVGASKKLGAAIRLAGITSGITSVSLDNGFSGESTGYQQGNGGIVIPILSDAHYALAQTTDRGFINTVKGGKTAEAKVLNITIQCASESVANSINSDNIDLYITNDDYEIHTYQWRDNAALGRVASELETGKYVWAIAVPYEFRYPQEYQVITGAYSKFEKWAHSPQNNSKWYKKYDESLVY